MNVVVNVELWPVQRDQWVTECCSYGGVCVEIRIADHDNSGILSSTM